MLPLVSLLVIAAQPLAPTFAAANSATRADPDDAEVRAARQAALFALEVAARDETASLALDADARAGRTVALDALRAYADAGVFPHNHTSAEPVAVFIDGHGTHCAVAEMIRATGFADVARTLADEDNARRIFADETDARVLAWARDHGFTMTELSLIQEPGYTFREDDPPARGIGEPRARTVVEKDLRAPLMERDAARTLAELQPQLNACLAKGGGKRSRVTVTYAVSRDGRARGVTFAAPVDPIGAGCVRAALGDAKFARADGAALAQTRRTDTLTLRAPAKIARTPSKRA